jgi:hypothetical protein
MEEILKKYIEKGVSDLYSKIKDNPRIYFDFMTNYFYF